MADLKVEKSVAKKVVSWVEQSVDRSVDSKATSQAVPMAAPMETWALTWTVKSDKRWAGKSVASMALRMGELKDAMAVVWVVRLVVVMAELSVEWRVARLDAQQAALMAAKWDEEMVDKMDGLLGLQTVVQSEGKQVLWSERKVVAWSCW